MTLLFVRPLLLIATMTMLSGCAVMGGAMSLRMTDAMTDGNILPVTDNPKSLGRKRLETYSGLVPSLKTMFVEKGYPDRVIESVSFGGSRKVVMYYTKQGVAYLLVAGQFAMTNAKIVGPSPIGEKTKELFAAMDKLQRVAGEIAAENGKPAAKR